MTCQVCRYWKRRSEDEGDCFSASALRDHGFDGFERAAVRPDHSCSHHEPKVVTVCQCLKPYPSVIQDGDTRWYQCDFCGHQVVPVAYVDAFDERVAIAQFDGNLSARDAEQVAVMDARAAMFREGRSR